MAASATALKCSPGVTASRVGGPSTTWRARASGPPRGQTLPTLRRTGTHRRPTARRLPSRRCVSLASAVELIVCCRPNPGPHDLTYVSPPNGLPGGHKCRPPQPGLSHHPERADSSTDSLPERVVHFAMSTMDICRYLNPFCLIQFRIPQGHVRILHKTLRSNQE
jgi:hypothetical protein